jgi:hypothetical protein
MVGETTVAGSISRTIDTNGSAWPNPARAWFAVGVFHFTPFFPLIDRQIFSLQVVPVKRYPVIYDTHMSLLMALPLPSFTQGVIKEALNKSIQDLSEHVK